MHIWRNRLVAGCVDKASFGKHGLLHVFYVSAGWGYISTVKCCFTALEVSLGCCMASPLVLGGGGRMESNHADGFSATACAQLRTSTRLSCSSCLPPCYPQCSSKAF